VVLLVRHNAHRQPTITLSATKLQDEINHKNTFYHSQHNAVDQQTLRSDTTWQLAGDSLVYTYAKEHNITVTQNEIDSAYHQRVSASGSEQHLLNQLNQLYGTTRQQYRDTISLDILKDKVQSKLGKPLTSWLNEELPHYHIVVTER
jgi:FKBP-type peptidyl-prolyl cis-trans isomerase (trigger factor)